MLPLQSKKTSASRYYILMLSDSRPFSRMCNPLCLARKPPVIHQSSFSELHSMLKLLKRVGINFVTSSIEMCLPVIWCISMQLLQPLLVHIYLCKSDYLPQTVSVRLAISGHRRIQTHWYIRVIHSLQPFRVGIEPPFRAELVGICTENRLVPVDDPGIHADDRTWRQVVVAKRGPFSGNHSLERTRNAGMKSHGFFDHGLA